jgi:hypothetical protein
MLPARLIRALCRLATSNKSVWRMVDYKMNESFKNLIQVISWVVLSVGGLIAAFKAIYEMQQNREQRGEELRWRRANVAKGILDELFSNPHSQFATLILDWSERQREYEVKKGSNQVISYNEVVAALGKAQQADLNDKEVFIRDCFDCFFYLIDRIDHSIRIKLISFEDVDAPLRRYAKKIEIQKETYENFMKSQGYSLAIQFFKRFERASTAA